MVFPIPVGDNIKEKGWPWTLFILIISCFGIFIYGRYINPDAVGNIVKYGALRPKIFLEVWGDVISDPLMLIKAPLDFVILGVVPVFSHMFLHAHELHLLGNMIFLFVFGKTMERRLGHLRFLFFYILCGIIAMIVHLIMDPMKELPMVGASGAIAGVLGGYLISFPRARIKLVLWAIILFTAEVPAFFFLLLWFLFQVINAQNTLLCLGGCEGIAYFAHVGGFIAGTILVFPFRKSLK